MRSTFFSPATVAALAFFLQQTGAVPAPVPGHHVGAAAPLAHQIEHEARAAIAGAHKAIKHQTRDDSTASSYTPKYPPYPSAVSSIIIELESIKATRTPAPTPTNLHHVVKGPLADPLLAPGTPKGGIGLNVTAYIEGDVTTGYGKPIPPPKKHVSPKAGFVSVAQTDPKGARVILPNGLWNGTYPLNSTEATYHPLSDFDFQSLQLALYQEYIELDLFRAALRDFSDEEFKEYGFTDADKQLLVHMSNQEIGHAELISNMLGPDAAKPCRYRYPYKTLGEYVNFSQWLTKWGESGVYGFLEHLDSRPTAQHLLQSITTEARQQMIFRQWEGLHAMPEWFETGITQSMAWTLLAPWIESCPDFNFGPGKLKWTNFPALNITSDPARGLRGYPDPYHPAINTVRKEPLAKPFELIEFSWEGPGKHVGPNNSYVTSSMADVNHPKFAAWISQLNVTYTPLENVDLKKKTAATRHPAGEIWSYIPDNLSQTAVNSTVFVVLTDSDPFITAFNMSRINDIIVAGPAMFQSG
ncbi:hypothetical protein BJ508DRAFT_419141 [Ascobolus immersus RN42]|uniref:Protein rds1 n=1 Tax=Ascobolus immersus RN42 TaxID=1160509 RepID=A0A3N4HGI5_ASCIM|nr:hypothetical protein BJ508DRAFT_419141 [Ascobolus immersus RN42]